jgi:hypothetical protein
MPTRTGFLGSRTLPPARQERNIRIGPNNWMEIDMNTNIRVLMIACALFGAATVAAAADATDGASAPASAASAIKHAAKKTGHAIAHGASEVATGTEHVASEAATGTAHAAHRAASGVRKELHKLPKGASAANPEASADKKGGQ